MEINVYANDRKMESKEIKAIGKVVLGAGFGIEKLERNSTGCRVWVIGDYYGKAVDAINALGYETDEDENNEE